MTNEYKRVDLSGFTGKDFDRGASIFKEALWVFVRSTLFLYLPLKLYGLKRLLLRVFGAKVGSNVLIKPGVKITFPWKLEIGDNVWLGEECWIHNFEPVEIGDNVCISQRAMLCTGNHDYKSPTFEFMNGPICIEEGAWIAAGAWVGSNVKIGSHAVLSAGSVASSDLNPYGVYQGVPAKRIRERHINSK